MLPLPRVLFGSNNLEYNVQPPLKSSAEIWVTEYSVASGRVIFAVLGLPVVLAVQESVPLEYVSQSSEALPLPPETDLLPASSFVQRLLDVEPT